MKRKLFTTFLFQLILIVLCLGLQNTFGQVRSDSIESFPQSLQDRLAEMRIKEEKKEFRKLIQRSETIAELTTEIRSSYEEHQALTSKDRKKLKKIRKLLKKVRRDLNAKGASKSLLTHAPKSVSAALDSLRDSTSELFNEVKKITRHSISVAAVQSSNTTWRLVKFLRLKLTFRGG